MTITLINQKIIKMIMITGCLWQISEIACKMPSILENVSGHWTIDRKHQLETPLWVKQSKLQVVGIVFFS